MRALSSRRVAARRLRDEARAAAPLSLA
jgi:hypothetical protein